MNVVLGSRHSTPVTYQGVLAIILVAFGCSPFVFAKAKPKMLQGLVEERPRFDSSLSIATFHLGVKHTELIGAQHKALLHAQDSLGLLRGGAHVFRLQSAEHGVQLQVQTPATARAVHGQVDKTGRALTGKVVQTASSPLNIIEHVRSPFQLDLRRLTADAAPDIVVQMEAEVGKARSKSADNVARQKMEMEPKLQGGTAHPDLPLRTVKANEGLSSTVESAIAQSKQHDQEAGRQAAQQLSLVMARGGATGDRAPKLPGAKVASVPRAPEVPSQHSTDHDAAKRSERELVAELARANQQTPPAKDLKAKLDGARNRAQTQVAAVRPGLDAILTHARYLPATSLPAVPNAALQGDVYDVVPWDEWHARFAQLARAPILINVSKAKNPSGSNTVQITVWPDHRLDVKLAKSSNAAFDRAILDAYKILAGNPALEFPKRSRRKSITFLVDNEHSGAGVPSGVKSQTSLGDKEVIRFHL